MPAPIDAVARHALSLPEAWEDFPWEGDRVAKVRKQIFAFLGGSLGVKLPTSAGYALSLGCATPMAYGLGRHGWVTIDLGHPTAPDSGILCDWVVESYRAVAPVTLVRQLDTAP